VCEEHGLENKKFKERTESAFDYDRVGVRGVNAAFETPPLAPPASGRGIALQNDRDAFEHGLPFTATSLP
jgi:hypothetical protein